MRKRQDPTIRQNVFLDAAEKLFFSKGYEQTSITDILKAVGDVSPSVFYYYFSSKEEIFKATMRRFVETHSKETIDAILREPDYTEEAIEKILDGIQTVNSDFAKVDGYFNKSKSDSRQFHQTLMEESMHILQQPLQAYIEKAMENGTVQATHFLKEAGAEVTTSVFLHAVFALFHKDMDSVSHTNTNLKLISTLISQLIGIPGHRHNPTVPNKRKEESLK